jgi:hypothetical protein
MDTNTPTRRKIRDWIFVIQKIPKIRPHSTHYTMVRSNQLLALVPLSIPLVLCGRLLGNPLATLQVWVEQYLFRSEKTGLPSMGSDDRRDNAVSSQLLAYMIMAFAGYLATARLVPHIQQYTLRKGIAGKDLGKRGTATADQPMCVTCYIHKYFCAYCSCAIGF